MRQRNNFTFWSILLWSNGETLAPWAIRQDALTPMPEANRVKNEVCIETHQLGAFGPQ
jgi:hypothetical protein